MKDASAVLAEVRELNSKAKPGQAEALMRELFGSMEPDTLRAHEIEVRGALTTFFKKRRTILVAELETCLTGPRYEQDGQPSSANADQDSQPTSATAGPAVPAASRISIATPSAARARPAVGSPLPGSSPTSGPGSTSAVGVGMPGAEVPDRLAVVTTPSADSPNPPESATSRTPSVLAEVCRLNAAVRVNEAERAFRDWLDGADSNEIQMSEEAARDALKTFHRKRANTLSARLDAALDAARPPGMLAVGSAKLPAVETPTTPHAPALRIASSIVAPTTTPETVGPTTVARAAPSELKYTAEQFELALADLSSYHIFQWATFYRDRLSEYFEVFLFSLEAAITRDRHGSAAILNAVRDRLSRHSREIFEKGYNHVRTQANSDTHFAIGKSLAGLQRFLDLPIEFYSVKLANAHKDHLCGPLRLLTSAMLRGILSGYCRAMFNQEGRELLPRFPRSWAYVLPFFTREDLTEIIQQMEHGDFASGAQDAVMPLAEAIDALVDTAPNEAPMPAVAQFNFQQRCVEVSLQIPPEVGARLLEVQCFLFPIDRRTLEEAAARAVTAVVAPMRPDLRALVASNDRLHGIAVATNDGNLHNSASRRLQTFIEDAIYSESAVLASARTIDYNYAGAFPLADPFVAKYFHVDRRSVRHLMMSFERRNGVRLWCSVRRSGKTTACASDLDSTSDRSVLISQTCDDTGQLHEGSMFYDSVVDSLHSGNPLPKDHVRSVLARCAAGQRSIGERMVFVLDEYETLFGKLRTAIERDRGVRYTVVQPLLNQLVQFASENLIVFLGQQPNAHFILMDQNQLSPYVEQDAFPLFSHDRSSEHGEFQQLLNRVLTNHIRYDQSFANAVYDETGGHPYLTVNLLIAFMEWLIQERWPRVTLSHLTADPFLKFAQSELTLSVLARSAHYDFFQKASAAAISPISRRENQWLYGVYSVLREIALDSRDSLECSVSEFLTVAARHTKEISPEELLSTATRANFFKQAGDAVTPRIRILARLAAAATP